MVADGFPLALIGVVGLSLYKRNGFFWNRYKTATNMEQFRDVVIVGLPTMLVQRKLANDFMSLEEKVFNSRIVPMADSQLNKWEEKLTV